MCFNRSWRLPASIFVEKQVTTTVEAGRKGGLKVLESRGRAFYSRIGHLGQLAMRRKYPAMASEWGKKGGRPPKLPLNSLGEESK